MDHLRKLCDTAGLNERERQCVCDLTCFTAYGGIDHGGPDDEDFLMAALSRVNDAERNRALAVYTDWTAYLEQLRKQRSLN
jgi:hypothetical protein